MDIHRALLHNVFAAMRALDPMLYVTTEPIPIDTASPRPAPAPTAEPTPPRDVRSGAGQPVLPAVGVRAVGSAFTRVPAIPALAAGLFVMALLVGSCSALGIFAPTTTPELCSSYRDAKNGFSYSSDDSFADFLDKENLGDELAELEDRAGSYDDGDVKDDADNIGDFGDTVTESQFDSATTHIAQIC